MGEPGTVWAVVSLTIIAVVALGALAGVIAASRRQAQATTLALGLQGAPGDQANVWIVANPTKVGNFEKFRALIDAEVERATGQRATWLETTVEDPGTGQTIQALRHRPSLVIACGGDGTVRAVAAGMAHSRIPFGLIPMGTGNLMARNLGIPLDSVEAIRVALTPISRRVDLAWLRVERVEERSEFPSEGQLLIDAHASLVRHLPSGIPEPLPSEYSYLVIAGVGFDGETMAHTRPELKKAMGWSAYVITAMRSLRIERMKATVTIFKDPDASPTSATAPFQSSLPIPRGVQNAVRASHTIGAAKGVSPAIHSEDTWEMSALRARTVLFANCGELPFAQLSPDAVIDDGNLDVIAIDTKGGLVGWMYLSVKVFGHTIGLRPINTKIDLATIQFRQTPKARVDISRAYPVQIDGDPIGSARTVIARVDRNALLVRVPQGSPAAIPEWDRRI